MEYLNEKLAFSYKNFNSIDDYKTPANVLKKEDFFSKLKNNCPDDEETEQTNENIKLLDIENGELTQLYLKSDLFLLADVF